MGDFPPEEVRATIEMIQGFDPVGVAAHDLVECLTAQLKHRGAHGPPAKPIARYHRDKLQNRRYKELAEVLGVSMDDLHEELEIIRHLDPRPGPRFKLSTS